jgi:hypothetical protein
LSFVLIRVYPRQSAVRFFLVSDPGDLLRFSQMEKRIFWMLFIVLGLIIDVALPLWWGLALTLPLAVFCWWVAYRSGWFS